MQSSSYATEKPASQMPYHLGSFAPAPMNLGPAGNITNPKLGFVSAKRLLHWFRHYARFF